MTPADLLAAVRAAQGFPSNYRLAAAMGIAEKLVSRWNVGRGAPDDATAERLAEAAGLDPDATVAAMHAWRAHDEAERARWERIAARLAAAPAVAACVLAAAILALWTTGGPDGGAFLGGEAVAGLWASGFTPYTLACITLGVATLAAGFTRRAAGR